MAGDWRPVGKIEGRDGVGVPPGGAQGEVLKKVGGTDFATAWAKVNYEDIEGKVPASAMPEISLEPYVVTSEAQMLNLPAVPGRMAIRTDIGQTFVLAEEPASDIDNWIPLQTSSDVTSVNGKTGAVTVTKADVGLANVSNTSDSDKPLVNHTVRGLMSPEHYVLLRDASPYADMDTLMLRDFYGRSKVSDPESDMEVANKRYADSQAKAQFERVYDPSMIAPQSIDLDTIRTPGLRRVTSSSPGLPIIGGFRYFGVLETVRESSTHLTQTLHPENYHGNGVSFPNGAYMDAVRKDASFRFVRSAFQQGGLWHAWSDWKMVGATGLIPIISGTGNSSPAEVRFTSSKINDVANCNWWIDNGTLRMEGSLGTTDLTVGEYAVGAVSSIIAPPARSSAFTGVSGGANGRPVITRVDPNGQIIINVENSSTGTRQAINGLFWRLPITKYAGD